MNHSAAPSFSPSSVMVTLKIASKEAFLSSLTCTRIDWVVALVSKSKTVAVRKVPFASMEKYAFPLSPAPLTNE